MSPRRQASAIPNVSRRTLIAVVALPLAVFSVGTVSAMTYYGGKLERQECEQRALRSALAEIRREQAQPEVYAPLPAPRAGADGRVGADGVDGVDGLDGLDGTNGLDGRDGANGADGLNGVQGTGGVMGPPGEQGDSGDKGETGEQGVQGLRGVQGEPGLQGVRGETGLKGDTGDAGDAGAQGLQGIQGVQGVQGAQGLQGVQGDAGLKGDKGDQGDAGPAGPAGPTGATGPIGATGATGAAGPKGDDGLDAPVDTDATMAANSDAVVPSQKAVKTALAGKAAANVGTTRPFIVASGEWWLTTIGGNGVTSLNPSSNAANSNNLIRYTPFYLSESTAIDGMAIYVSIANAGPSAVVGLAIFDANPTTGKPRNVVADAGTQSINTTGMKTMTFSAVSLAAGYYWAAVTTRGLDTAGTNPAYYAATGFVQSVGESSPQASNNMLPLAVGTSASWPVTNPPFGVTRSFDATLPHIWLRKG